MIAELWLESFLLFKAAETFTKHILIWVRVNKTTLKCQCHCHIPSLYFFMVPFTTFHCILLLLKENESHAGGTLVSLASPGMYVERAMPTQERYSESMCRLKCNGHYLSVQILWKNPQEQKYSKFWVSSSSHWDFRRELSLLTLMGPFYIMN